MRPPERRGRGLRPAAGMSAPTNREEAREEGSWARRAWGLGKVDPTESGLPAAPAALASASPGCCQQTGCAHRGGPSFFLRRGDGVLKPERVPAARLAGRAGNGGTLSFRRL